jgi:hypothetical protein
LLGLAPKVFRYRTQRSDDGVLRTRLKALAAARRRFGYRRLHLLLKREGFVVNHKNCTGSTGRKSSSFAGAAAASGLLARAHRSHFLRARTAAGRSTSSPTPSAMVAASAFSCGP